LIPDCDGLLVLGANGRRTPNGLFGDAGQADIGDVLLHAPVGQTGIDQRPVNHTNAFGPGTEAVIRFAGESQ